MIVKVAAGDTMPVAPVFIGEATGTALFDQLHPFLIRSV
jgi:hypothetical protein